MMKKLLLTTLLLLSFTFIYSQGFHFPTQEVPKNVETATSYTVSPNYLQDTSSLDQPDSTPSENVPIDVFMNFIFDTTGDNFWVVYTTDGTPPTKTNGAVESAGFVKYDDPDRIWRATIPGQSAGEDLFYVIYANTNGGDLASANQRLSPNGWEGTWTEGDSWYSAVILLPVTLTSFDVERAGNASATIKWQAASETNFSHYELQRSTNGQDFETIETIYSNPSMRYSVTDNFEQLYVQKVYYRLQSVDWDNSAETSQIKQIQLEAKTPFIFNNGLQEIQFLQTSECATGSLRIYSMNGTVVYHEKIDACSVTNISLEAMEKGNYIAIWESEQQRSSLQFVVGR